MHGICICIVHQCCERVLLYLNHVADEEDDRESGIQVSDVEEMELGGEGNTPVDGQVPKGLPGMASSGRRGRTFSTGMTLCVNTNRASFM